MASGSQDHVGDQPTESQVSAMTAISYRIARSEGEAAT
jgi:hypothetical protein